MHTLLALLVFLFAYTSHADIITEGWYKIMSANVHVGYMISRYEYDPKARQFISKSFLKTNAVGGDITESVEAFSDEGMKPIRYRYTSLAGKVATKIDAEVKKDKLMVVMEKDGIKTTEGLEIPKGAFLSAHLPLLMLKKGLKVGTNFAYQAIAEEDGKIYQGKSLVKETVKAGERDVFRLLNDFKDVKFISLIDSSGQVVATKAPSLGITTNLVAGQKEAAGDIPVAIKSLKKIFGSLP